jgi:hypothetical protein
MNIAGYIYVTHKLINRPWGPECRFTVRRPDGTLIDDVVNISSMDISNANLVDVVTNHLSILKGIKDREALVCHLFDDAGIEVKEALRWLVRKVREFPNATYAQAEIVWNAEWSNSLFTFAKLTVFLQKRVGDVTWAQFKTYVIDHRFEGVD